MLSTGVLAFFGFFFWIINARLFDTHQVGIATTLISIMTLIASLSILGFGNGLIKYLPTSTEKNEKINTSFTLVSATAAILSLIFLLFINFFSPDLLFIRENVILSILFILFVLFSALNILSESVFIAYRSSAYVFAKNTILSITKLALPIALIGFGSYGIFMSVGIAATIAFIFSIFILTTKFNYLIKILIDRSIVQRMIKFSIGNYLAVFIGGLPQLALPIIITNTIGASFSAYFYMDMMIASLLFIVPLATSQSLFAEGSYSEAELKSHLKKAIKIISIFMIPGIIATILLGKYILLAFGKQYSSEGELLLNLLAISGVFMTINYLGNAIFFIKHKVGIVIFVNVVGASLIMILSIILSHHNLTGIGTAWIIGSGVSSLIYLGLIKKYL